jgi:hypothetical protein
MQFKANRALKGDYGTVHPGEVFTVDAQQAKRMEKLEARGVIERFTPRVKVDRKAYTVFENKAIVAAGNKATGQ